jgi:hypothetical protein
MLRCLLLLNVVGIFSVKKYISYSVEMNRKIPVTSGDEGR